MDDSLNRKAIDALVETINAGDQVKLDSVFTEDVVIEWPQSKERIVGNENRRQIYTRFPSFPKAVPHRVTGSGNLWALEASLDYGDGDPFLCMFLFEIHAGRIAREIGYWSKPFPAPEWRAPFVEQME